jgi:DNA adenine methylase
MEGQARPLLKRTGGKYRLYKKIIANFPEGYTEMTYVEPFVGGGSIFFNKERCKKEVINDFDDIMYNFYKETQKDYKVLEKRINGTYTEKDFYKLKDMKPTSIMGKTVQHYILGFLSYLGFKLQCDIGRAGGTHRIIDRDLEPYHIQLENVTILNEDYKKVIEKYDSPNTFFYLDPPYEDSTKNISEYKDIDMDDFANVIYKVKGKFLMSINNSPNIRRLFKGYKIKKIKAHYELSPKYVAELLISNY